MREFNGGASVETTDRGGLRLIVKNSTGEAISHRLTPEEVDALREALTPALPKAAPSTPSSRRKSGKER